MVLAESDLYLDDGTINYEKYPACHDHNIEDMSKYPDSLTVLCSYKWSCENYDYRIQHDRAALEEDYVVQQFLHKNSLSLDGISGSTTNTDLHGGVWSIPRDKKIWDEQTYPKLAVSFDVCSNVKQYTYFQSGNSPYVIKYPTDDWKHPEKVPIFEQQRYDLITTIMERHPPPKVQVSEFNILPEKIHCNEGLELYKRNDSGEIPVCLKPQTYEQLLERGFDLSRYDDDGDNNNE